MNRRRSTFGNAAGNPAVAREPRSTLRHGFDRTRGSNTQSAALALRRHGAKYVSVMVMGRVLAPGYMNNAAFIRERLYGRDYDPYMCPVTGSDCP